MGAIAHGLAYGGWCPQGGWAEDFPTAPGLRAHYPHLRETPSPDPAQRTEWNVRDSTATLILVRGEDGQRSAGTQLTQAIATYLGKPLQIINLNEAIALASLRAWLQTLPQNATLNIAGPRESESPGIYAIAHKTLLHSWRTNPTE